MASINQIRKISGSPSVFKAIGSKTLMQSLNAVESGVVVQE